MNTNTATAVPTPINGVDTDWAGTWVAVGALGEIHKSTTGGVSWSPVASGTASTLYDVTTNRLGFWLATGVGGVAVRSTDNGTNWSTVSTGVGSDLRTVTYAP